MGPWLIGRTHTQQWSMLICILPVTVRKFVSKYGDGSQGFGGSAGMGVVGIVGSRGGRGARDRSRVIVGGMGWVGVEVVGVVSMCSI